MAKDKQHRSPTYRIGLRAATAALALVIAVLAAPSTQAQTFTVIHNFTGGQDGANPVVGVAMDRAGNLYGTTYAGGADGYGTVFRLSYKGAGWIFTPLYAFKGGNDGANPEGVVAVGADGSFYGSTYEGGNGLCSDGCGTVFNLRPPPTAPISALESWTETVLYRFTGSPDGECPTGPVIFNATGSIYLTAEYGGRFGDGAVVRLMPSNGGWTESVIYNFTGRSDGYAPFSGVIFDNSGNLYGTTGGYTSYGFGTVDEFTPSGSEWVENTLYAFQGGNDGEGSAGGLIMDEAGNLYGTTDLAGSGGGGTVFELLPSNDSWTLAVVYSFSGSGGSVAALIMDATGALYGTTVQDGAHQYGSVFKLAPSNGAWTYTSLHDFTGGSDGAYPYGSLILGPNGSLYGTASAGGAYGYGVVFEITP